MFVYEDFEKAINEIKKNNELIDRANNVLKATDFLCELSMQETVVGLLEEIFDDDEHWISYWIYDSNFGEDFEVWNPDGSKIVCNTPKQLFDFLVKNCQEKHKGE